MRQANASGPHAFRPMARDSVRDGTESGPGERQPVQKLNGTLCIERVPFEAPESKLPPKRRPERSHGPPSRVLLLPNRAAPLLGTCQVQSRSSCQEIPSRHQGFSWQARGFSPSFLTEEVHHIGTTRPEAGQISCRARSGIADLRAASTVEGPRVTSSTSPELMGSPPRLRIVQHPCGGRLHQKLETEIRNDLLSALPQDDLARLLPSLERVELKRRQILHERNIPVSHGFFIETGAASLLSRASGSKDFLEVSTLGRRDFVGLPILLGTTRSPHRCQVQVPGEALRIGAADLQQAMRNNPALQQLLLGYLQVAMVHSSQLVLCSTRHNLRQRLARWLLVTHDALDCASIPVTHQVLSRALGVRRAGITTTLQEFEAAQLITCRRGNMIILDRCGLEAESCGCSRAMKAEHQHVIDGASALVRND